MTIVLRVAILVSVLIFSVFISSDSVTEKPVSATGLTNISQQNATGPQNVTAQQNATGPQNVTAQQNATSPQNVTEAIIIPPQNVTAQQNATGPQNVTEAIMPLKFVDLIKHVINDNFGTKHAQDFEFLLTGDLYPNGVMLRGSEAPGIRYRIGGTFAIRELPMEGYQMSAQDECSSVREEVVFIDCTFINNDIPPPGKVIVEKLIINDDGGSSTGCDFLIRAIGVNPSATEFRPFSPCTALTGKTTITFDAGAYDITEVGGPVGYASSFSGDCSGIVRAGEIKRCVIKNDDIVPKLTVIKHVINDNGETKQPTDFTLTVDGNNPSMSTFAGADLPGTEVTLDPGPYSVSESGTQNLYDSTLSPECSGTISIGQVKRCIITNNDIPTKGVVNIIKHVINDDGGTKQPSDFTINVVGNSPSISTLTGRDLPGTRITLLAGTFDIQEPDVAGYSKSFSDACSGDIQIGEVKTCVITNNDIPPKLTVVKRTINDNGGTKQPSDFTITVTGNNVLPSNVFTSDENGKTITLSAGQYSVQEGAIQGYSMSLTRECSGNINVGDIKTCIISNYDIPPKLTVIKHVINDNGGTKQPSDFTITVTGNNVFPSSTFRSDDNGNTVTLNTGSFNVAEDDQQGYSATFLGECSGTINIGELKICTINNDDPSSE